MRSRSHRIAARARMRVARHGSTITLRWVEQSGGTLDAATREKVGATSTNKSTTVKALVHFVGPATSGVRIYNEIQIGDAILDLDPSVALDGKKDLTFEFGDAVWAQKKVGKELAMAWDTIWQDQKIFRTVLVTRQE